MTETGKKRLEFFESGYALNAVNLGIISPFVFMKFIHYKEYITFMREGLTSKEAAERTAQRAKCTLRTVWRSIKYFS